jgi:hypothetical protein
MSAPGSWNADDQPLRHRPPPAGLLAGGMLWLTGFLSGLMASILMSSEQRQRLARDRWTRQWRRRMAQLAGPSEAPDAAFHSIEALRQLLVGRNRAYIVEALGPPPAVSPSGAIAPASRKPPHYWYAEVWYYPLDVRQHQAVAFAFKDDRVRTVERLTGPG